MIPRPSSSPNRTTASVVAPGATPSGSCPKARVRVSSVSATWSSIAVMVSSNEVWPAENTISSGAM